MIKGSESADMRGVMPHIDYNIPLGHKVAFIHESHASSGFTCGQCGSINAFETRTSNREQKRRIRQSMAEKFCLFCHKYADGRETGSVCKKLPNGPGSSCSTAWPNIKSVWCEGCKGVVVDR